jgi:anti-sigma-K factor RskA
MNHDLAITLLDDHVDGLLSAEQNAELEAHLADCAACRDELAQLRDLLAQTAALPAELLPERDLWAGIAAEIEPSSSAARQPTPVVTPPWHTRPRVLLLAAALLVGTTAVVTRLLDSPAPAPSVAVAPEPAPAPLAPLAWEQEMTTASTALSQTLDARKGDLRPATVAILEDNLAIIDSAIEECRAALDGDPANTDLEGALFEAWQRKVGLLERAGSLPPNS